MLPDHVGIILLSATVPNTKEFADWVGRTKKKDIFVISTPKRPVPLEHFLYAGKELHKVVDAKGAFLGTGHKEANEANRRKQDKEREAAGVPPPGAAAGRGGRGGGGGGQAARGSNRGGGQAARQVAARGAMAAARRAGGTGALSRSNAQARDANLWIHLVGLLRKKELLPVVVFTFSKKRCEENAASMPNTDMCTAAEKSEVHITIERSLTRLKGAPLSLFLFLPRLTLLRGGGADALCAIHKGSDKDLPQIKNMRSLLSRGIGVHHGGLLPIVKEVRHPCLCCSPSTHTALTPPNRGADGRAPLCARARQGALRDRDLRHGACLYPAEKVDSPCPDHLHDGAGRQHARQVRCLLGHPQARRPQLPRAAPGRVVRPPFLSLSLTPPSDGLSALLCSTQMSGRAGRRGLDKTGVVIINADSEVPDVRGLALLILSRFLALTCRASACRPTRCHT